MEKDRLLLVWELSALAAAGAKPEEVVGKAKEVKDDIHKKLLALWRQSNILNEIVAFVAPEAEWERGFPEETDRQAPLLQATVDRGKRALIAAEELYNEGTRTVSSKAVAELLIKYGFSGSVRDLSISAGNALARSVVWRKVKAGHYRRIE